MSRATHGAGPRRQGSPEKLSRAHPGEVPPGEVEPGAHDGAGDRLAGKGGGRRGAKVNAALRESIRRLTRTWPCTRSITGKNCEPSSTGWRGSVQAPEVKRGCTAGAAGDVGAMESAIWAGERIRTPPAPWTGVGPRCTTRASPGNEPRRRCSWNTGPIPARWTPWGLRPRMRARAAGKDPR